KLISLLLALFFIAHNYGVVVRARGFEDDSLTPCKTHADCQIHCVDYDPDTICACINNQCRKEILIPVPGGPPPEKSIYNFW
ncbi:unnamed protein product, partial [Linum tenue]